MGGFVSNCTMGVLWGRYDFSYWTLRGSNFVPQNSPMVQFDTTRAISKWPISIVCKMNSSLLVARLIPDPVTRYQSKTHL